MYLIDSDIIIYSLKNNPIVRHNFQEKAAIPKAISVISYGELFQTSPFLQFENWTK
jgi:tRNA(fMet)-specific endonuclease VapC